MPRTWFITIIDMNMLDRFFEATRCSPITIILALGIVVLLWVVGKLWFRNTSLSNHVMEADKNNAVASVELMNLLDKILKDDEVNADKILTAIENLRRNVKNTRD